MNISLFISLGINTQTKRLIILGFNESKDQATADAIERAKENDLESYIVIQIMQYKENVLYEFQEWMAEHGFTAVESRDMSQFVFNKIYEMFDKIKMIKFKSKTDTDIEADIKDASRSITLHETILEYF